MSKGFTIVLGIADVAGALGVAFGVLTQLAAFGLILLWERSRRKSSPGTPDFWGEKTYGRHYDLMFILMNLLIVFTDGGQYVLVR